MQNSYLQTCCKLIICFLVL